MDFNRFLFFCLLIFFPLKTYSQYVENNPATLPISKPESTDLAGKGIFGVQVLLGASYDKINTGIVAVDQKDTTNKKDVMLGPGGGGGFEIYGGKQYTKHFRMGVHAGFQYASGIPDIKDATIRFRKFYVAPMLNLSSNISAKSSLELGAGAFISFANSLLLEGPKGANFKPVEITYKKDLGFATHIYFQSLLSDKTALFGGLRFNWSLLEVADVKVGNNNVTLNQAGNERYNNKNSGGVAFVFGFNFFF